MGATYMECSSKEMRGVEEVFEAAINTAVGEDLAARRDHQNPSQASSGRPGKRSKKRMCRIL
jgi:Ras family protein A